MDEIIVGFSRPKAWLEPFSWLIRLITWAPMSHAYIKYQDPYTSRWIIYQASGLKVNFIGKTSFDNIENVIAEFNLPVSNETKQKLVQGAIDTLGVPYGTKQLLGYLYVVFVRLFGKIVTNPLYDASSFFCSELASDDLEEIGLSGLDPSVTSPKDLYNFMLSKGFKPINS
jgi:hypothetical protein